MRKCLFCSKEIKECMGFVLARDIINDRTSIREICGICGLDILEMDEEQLDKKINSIKEI